MNESVKRAYFALAGSSPKCNLAACVAGFACGSVLAWTRRNVSDLVEVDSVETGPRVFVDEVTFDAVLQSTEEAEPEIDIPSEAEIIQQLEELPEEQRFLILKAAESSTDDSDVEESRPQNIFDEKVTEEIEWDWDAERAFRDSNMIYPLHEDEYFANESELDQNTLTWYVEDSVLADEADNPIYNHSQLVGDMPFGKGTLDKDVCYIRNLPNKVEWEILRHPGSYEEEVLGIYPEKSKE